MGEENIGRKERRRTGGGGECRVVDSRRIENRGEDSRIEKRMMGGRSVGRERMLGGMGGG